MFHQAFECVSERTILECLIAFFDGHAEFEHHAHGRLPVIEEEHNRPRREELIARANSRNVIPCRVFSLRFDAGPEYSRASTAGSAKGQRLQMLAADFMTNGSPG